MFIVASVLTLARRRGSFKVTPKTGATGRQPGAVWPTLLAIAVLAGVSGWGLAHSQKAPTLNNAAFALRAQAIRIGKAILAHETASAGALEVLLPGPWANKGTYLVFNPSYVDPTTLEALATATGDAEFTALATSGTQLVTQLTKPLPPNWAIVNARTGQPTPVSGPTATSGPGFFSYDAPRTLVRFGADRSAAARKAVAPAWSVFSQTAPQDIVTQHQLSGAAAGDAHNPITLVAVAGAAKAAGASGKVVSLLDQAQRFNQQYPSYYGAAWVALGRLLLTTDRLVPCSR